MNGQILLLLALLSREYVKIQLRRVRCPVDNPLPALPSHSVIENVTTDDSMTE